MTIADDGPRFHVNLRKPSRATPVELSPVELDAEPRVPVDSALDAASRTWHDVALRPPAKQPILTAWLKDRQAVGDVARYGRGFVWHRIQYHGVRLPTVYAGRALRRAPRGAWRVARTWARWQFDSEGAPARAAAVQSDPALYLRLTTQRNERIKTRAWISFGVGLAVLVALLWATVWGPPWVVPAAVLGALAVLGIVGSSKDKPLVGPAVINREAPRLTADVIVRALGALGIGELNKALTKDINAVEFPAPITRDGPGWRAEIELPYGVAASSVIEKREQLAAGLKRPLGCVWPECNSEIHPGRLILWVGDQDLAKARQPAWPLLKSGRTDLFKAMPFGTDARGRNVSITLMYASMVVGAVSRMGKTFSIRLLALAAALDPRAMLLLFDLKGTGDFSALEPIAHRYRSGWADEDIKYLHDSLGEVEVELERRSKVVRKLPREICPESKVTTELADRRDLKLGPMLIVVDECQMAYSHPTYGAEIERRMGRIVRLGPALGIIPINATQRPDANSIPSSISANALLRFCLKVKDQVANDMILGTSSYKAGIRATIFSRRDVGIGILSGEDDDPKIVRTYYVDSPAAARIVARARAIRESEGMLTGHALGLEPEVEERPGYDLLADVLDCVRPTERTAWSETVLEALAELRPEVYATWDTTMFAKALKPLGVETGDRKIGGIVKKGITIADVRAAAQAGEA